MRKVVAAAGMVPFAVVSFVGACVTLGSVAMLWADGSPLFALWWAVVAALVTALVGVLPAWGLWRWGFGPRPVPQPQPPLPRHMQWDQWAWEHGKRRDSQMSDPMPASYPSADPGQVDQSAIESRTQAYVDWAKGKQR